MRGILVNPFHIQKGDKIATSTYTTQDPKTGVDVIIVTKSRVIKKVSVCPSAPEFVHLDSECYDSRFSEVIRAV